MRSAVASDDALGDREVVPTSELNFPAKLHKILDTPAYNDIICWLHHGQSWQVLQPQLFEEEVLPLFFRHGRYASFIRQVNGWGFRRIANGADYNSYYHRKFIRGKPELCQEMKRPTKEERRKSMEIKSPPDFSQMEPQAAEQMGKAPSSASDALLLAPDRGGNSSLQPTFDVQTLPSISPHEQYFRLQRELEVLEQRRLEILSQLELLSLLGARASRGGGGAAIVPSGTPHSVLPPIAQQPISTTFPSQLDSLRILQALLLHQECQSDRAGQFDFLPSRGND